MLRIIASALFVLLIYLMPAKAEDALVIEDCGTLPTQLTVGPAHKTYQDKNGNSCVKSSPNNPSDPGFFTLSPASGIVYSSTTSLASSKVIKDIPASLYSFQVSADSTLSGNEWWIMIFNATSEPADGAVTPVKAYRMPASTTSYSAGFPAPIPFGTGITIVVSTTGPFTKTASAHAFISGDAQ